MKHDEQNREQLTSSAQPEDERKYDGEFLPPRHTKHGRRRPNTGKEAERKEESKQGERNGSFPLIQIIFYTFIAFILAFMLLWYWQNYLSDFISSGPPSANVSEPDENNERHGAEDLDQISEEEKPEPDPVQPPSSERNDSVNEEQGEGNGDEREAGEEGDRNQVELGSEEESEFVAETENETEPHILTEHIVQPGETLYSITMKYYGSRDYEDELAAYNDIEDKRNIRAGMTLIIPDLKP